MPRAKANNKVITPVTFSLVVIEIPTEAIAKV